MSDRSRTAAPVIHREYAPSTEHCIAALELLLKKAAAPRSRPDDDVKESDGYVATENHNR